MKKIYQIVVLVLLASVLVACGDAINTDVDFEVDLDNKIDLNVIYPNSGYSDGEFQSGYTAKLFEEMTGYKVNYKQTSDSGADNEITNALSSKEKYHVMKLAEGQYEAHVANGAFVRLNELLDKYGQDLKATISEESWASVTDKDGNIFAVPETAFSAMQDAALVFNMSHLKEVGYTDTPKTIGELTDVLQKLQTRYGSNSNYHALGLTGSQADLTTISSAFELPLEFFVNDQNEIENYIYSDAYVNYIKYMNGLVRDNILAASWSTQLASDVMSNFTKENISVGFMNYWTIVPLYEQMAATSKYNNIEEAKADIQWQLKIKGDGTNGSTVQSEAKYRTDVGNAYYITIPIYMAQEAAYAIDWMNTKIKDDNYLAFYAGKEGESFEKTTSEDPDAILVNYEDEDVYYKLLPGFSSIKGNSMYATGGNSKVGTAFWKLREKGFEAWSVTTEIDDTIITNPMSLRPLLPNWSKVSIVARSYILTLTQQAINSQREGSKSMEGIIETLRTSFKQQYWTSTVDNEIQTWFKSK